MKKILVPCDFSKPAVNAYRFALDVAAQSKGTIELLHVVELPVLHDTVLMPVLNFEEALLNELKENAFSNFQQLLKKYNKADLKVNFKVVFGSIPLMITDFIDANKIDLVIMGSHGATGLREIFIGSNAEKIVRRSNVPVLIIKEYFKGTVKNIVFPTNLEHENQEDLVQHVKLLQDFFKAKIHIVRINTPLNFAADTVTHAQMNAFVKRYMLKNYTINIFNYPNEEAGILQFSNMINADIIAMGTHGRKGLAHLFNGSTTEDVVNHADKIIWTYAYKNEFAEA